MATENLLSWKEAARILDVSSPTMYAIVSRGELAPAKIQIRGGQTRRYFDRETVQALKRKREGEREEV